MDWFKFRGRSEEVVLTEEEKELINEFLET